MSFIQLQRAGRGDQRTVYVALATSTRLPGKKHPRQTRVHLGCLCSDGTNVAVAKSITGALRINVPLQSLRDQAERGGPDLLQWLAQQIPARAPVEQSKGPAGGDGRPTTVKKIGPAFVMRNIARDLGLEEILCECFDTGESTDGLAILYLSMYQVAECRPLYQAYAWMDEQELPAEIGEYDFASAGASRLTARIGNDHAAIDRFFRMWIKKLGSPTSLIFDTTSVSSYSNHLDFAEWGYNRDGENLPPAQGECQRHVVLLLPQGIGWRVED